jgi:hypothetical protein
MRIQVTLREHWFMTIFVTYMIVRTVCLLSPTIAIFFAAEDVVMQLNYSYNDPKTDSWPFN